MTIYGNGSHRRQRGVEKWESGEGIDWLIE